MSNSLPPEILAEIEREADVVYSYFLELVEKDYDWSGNELVEQKTTSFKNGAEWAYTKYVLPLKEEVARLEKRIEDVMDVMRVVFESTIPKSKDTETEWKKFVKRNNL